MYRLRIGAKSRFFRMTKHGGRLTNDSCRPVRTCADTEPGTRV